MTPLPPTTEANLEVSGFDPPVPPAPIEKKIEERLTPPKSTGPKIRLTYIDWLRGFACILMLQGHCYDSWLGTSPREAWLLHWSQFLDTIPAPLFLFLSGVSFALVTGRLRDKKNLTDNQIAQTTILRGAEIFGFGLLFRLQEYVLGRPKAPWTDLFRVDVLNVIGLSIVLMGVLCWIFRKRATNFLLALFVSSGIVLFTPLVWTTWRPRSLPWYLESYVNGIHIFDQPQPWLFPIFPWTAFAFAGLATGLFLFGPWAKKNEARALFYVGSLGAIFYAAGLWFDSRPIQIYKNYDFWHTSPNFFLARCGIVLALLLVSYIWCRWGSARRGFSPLIQMGQTSLLIYWAHMEFVYGRLSILPKNSSTVFAASVGLLFMFLAMLAVSILRNQFKTRQSTAQIPVPGAASVSR
jgi:uncharacterized membrane protein